MGSQVESEVQDTQDFRGHKVTLDSMDSSVDKETLAIEEIQDQEVRQITFDQVATT